MIIKRGRADVVAVPGTEAEVIAPGGQGEERGERAKTGTGTGDREPAAIEAAATNA